MYGDITKATLPPLSALDVAVQYHLSDAVETLLDLGGVLPSDPIVYFIA